MASTHNRTFGRGKRVTLRTLANELGLSVTTVSRALKEGPEVHWETRDMVKQAAVQLGYRPNLGGFNLRTGKTNAVGVVLPFERNGEINIVVASFVEGMSRTLKAAGYRTLVVPQLQSDDPLATVQDLVEEGSVDAIVITHTRPQDERVKYLIEADIPFVTFGRTELLSPHASIDIDHEQIGADAARRLLDAGHTVPLLVAPPSQFTYSLQFVKGWTSEFNRRNLTVPDEHIMFASTTPDQGRQLAFNSVERYPDITAAFVASEEIALGFLAGLQALDRQATKDFAVMTCGGSALHDFFDPPLSSYNYSNAAIGRQATDLLLRLMAGDPPAGLSEVIEAEFLDRGSQFLR